MTGPVPTAELLFSAADATPMSTDDTTLKAWSHAQACLESAPKAWLSTVRPDGRPHAMPVLLVWVAGAPWFTTRPTSRKGRNLASNARCVVTVASEDLDLVVEGDAVRAREGGQLRQVAAGFEAKYGWVFAIRDGVVRDDSLPGAPEYGFYRLTPRRAFGYGADGLTATRWRFG